jgi:hypothetical protein
LPDLVVIHQERGLVVDVTVRHEDKGYLEEGHSSKVHKYTPLLPIISQQLQPAPGKVLPIVIGTRGALPKATLLSLEELGIKDRKSLITLTLLALRNSIEIYHAFTDYNVPRQLPITNSFRFPGIVIELFYTCGNNSTFYQKYSLIREWTTSNSRGEGKVPLRRRPSRISRANAHAPTLTYTVTCVAT